MKKRLMGSIFWMVVLAYSCVGFAQTAQQPGAAGAQVIPRTPDGKPDLSGTWAGGRVGGPGAQRTTLAMDSGASMELTKWGNDKFTWNRGPESANDPGVYAGQLTRVDQDPAYHCYPPGLVRLSPPYNTQPLTEVNIVRVDAIEIIQIPGKVIVLYPYRHEVRYIYTDGREHPKNLELTWNGHSIGKWDGDTLVVDTIGLRDENWLDSVGHEHSRELHVVERFRRLDVDRLEIERTLTDPIALAKPYTRRAVLRFSPDKDLDDNSSAGYDCTQFMMRKPAFGEGIGGVMGISEPPAEGY